MEYDKNSFLSGLSVGRALRGAGGGGGGFGIATETEIGGIKAKPKTDADTTEVHIDSNGFLWCAGGGGGGGSNPPPPSGNPGNPGRPSYEKYYTGVYGVYWNWGLGETECGRLTRTNDPHGLVGNDDIAAPEPMKNGEGGSSPFDVIAPWSGIEVYNVLNNGNYIKSGTDGFLLSGEGVNVMVWIPEFYYKIIEDTEYKQTFYYVSADPHDEMELHPGSGRFVSRYTMGKLYDLDVTSQTGLQSTVNGTMQQFRDDAALLGESWHVMDFATWSAIWLLYLVEYANLNSQAAVAQGYVNGSSPGLVTGSTDGMTYHTGWPTGTDGKTGMQYRHIENIWGNINQWCDGYKTVSGKHYVCLDPAGWNSDSSSSGYTEITLEATPWAVCPPLSGHSFSYDNNGFSSSGSLPVLFVGGYWSSTSNAGMWYCYDYSVSYSSGSIGARLLYIP